MKNVFKLSVALAGAMVLSVGAANADNIFIAFQEAGVDGGNGAGNISTVQASGTGSAVFLGGYGSFNFNLVTGTGSPNILFPELLNSNSSNSSALGGTINVFITETGVTTPTGQFVSGYTSNFIPAGWTLTEATLISNANALFSGTQISSATFGPPGNPLGTNALGTFSAGPGAYSITEEYTIHATQPGTGLNATINVSAVPGPIVGAGLPGLLAACGGLIALARRRRRQQA